MVKNPQLQKAFAFIAADKTAYRRIALHHHRHIHFGIGDQRNLGGVDLYIGDLPEQSLMRHHRLPQLHAVLATHIEHQFAHIRINHLIQRLCGNKRIGSAGLEPELRAQGLIVALNAGQGVQTHGVALVLRHEVAVLQSQTLYLIAVYQIVGDPNPRSMHDTLNRRHERPRQRISHDRWPVKYEHGNRNGTGDEHAHPVGSRATK